MGKGNRRRNNEALRGITKPDGLVMVNDVPQFFDNKVQQAFYNCFQQRPIALEREINFFNCPEEVGIMMEHHKWGDFNKQPMPHIEQIVREFYAYLSFFPDSESVYIRGKWVPFDRAHVDILLEVPLTARGAENEFTVAGRPRNYELLERIGNGATWTYTRAGLHETFPENELKSEASRLWHRFIVSRLYESEHFGTVRRKKAALLYWIEMGLPIDVSKLIMDKIRAQDNNGRNDCLPYAGLITELALEAGVERIIGDAVIDVQVALTCDSILHHTVPRRPVSPRVRSQPTPFPSMSVKQMLTHMYQEMQGRFGELEHNVHEIRSHIGMGSPSSSALYGNGSTSSSYQDLSAHVVPSTRRGFMSGSNETDTGLSSTTRGPLVDYDMDEDDD